MPLPAPGKVRLFPTRVNGVPVPAPLGMDVEVLPGDPPTLRTPFLPVMTYSAPMDVFTCAPDCGIACNGDGTFGAVLPGPPPMNAPLVVEGYCEPIPPPHP